MKKTLLTLTTLFLCFTAVVINAASPESFIPDKSPVIMRFNAHKAVRLPWVKELSQENKDFKKLTGSLDELKAKTGIAPEDFFAGEIWAAQYGKGQNDFVCFIQTALTKTKFLQLVNDAKFRKKEKFTVVSKVWNGLQVFFLEGTGKKAGKDSAIAYPAEDVMMCFTPKADAEKMIPSILNGGKNPLLKQIDRKALFALYGDARQIDLPTKKSRLRRLALTADLTGAEQRDLQINGNLRCKNENSAMQLAMQAQFMYPGIVGMLFGKDEQLAAALLGALQVAPQGDSVTIQFSLNAATQNKIFQYMSNPANRPDFKNNAVGPAPAKKVKK